MYIPVSTGKKILSVYSIVSHVSDILPRPLSSVRSVPKNRPVNPGLAPSLPPSLQSRYQYLQVHLERTGIS